MVSHTVQLVLYFVISNALALGTIIPMLEQSPTYFAAGVRLSEGFSIIILANWLIAVAIVLGKGLQRILFGDLRLIEIERIYERSRVAVITSLFALTMFTNDFLLIPGILTLFSLFMKVFHWILKDRFEYLFQNATTPRQLLLTRNSFTLLLLLYVDFNLVYSCAEYSFGRNPDVYFAFGFEFAILFLDLLFQAGQIAINTWELVYLNQNPDEDSMEEKNFYMKILELAHTSLTLMIYLFLLFTFIGPYRFPLYLFKDVFFKSISLMTQVRDFRRFQKAAKELDSRLQDAAEEDLDEDHNLCIICREDMTTIGLSKGERLYPKKLQCGHIIHMGCLKSWFARSQVCPMCRAPVFQQPQTQQQPQQQQQQAPPQPQPVDRPEPQPQPTAHHEQQHHNQGHENHVQGPQPIPTRTVPLLNTQTTTSSSSSSTTTTTGLHRRHPRASDPRSLVLSPNSIIPPDWTLMKLSNPSNNGNRYDLRLNGSQTAKIEKISQEPRISPITRPSSI